MLSLNLPTCEYKLKKTEGKILIFDVIRKKFVVLTPEEWVRQHFIHYMIDHLKYPKALIKVEGGLQFNHLKKRSDIVVYHHEGVPWMIVECKSPSQKIDQHTIRQASVYNSTIKARYVALTNGLKHVCCVIDHSEKTTTLLDGFPSYI